MNSEVKDRAGLCDVSQDWTWRLSGNCLNDVTLVAGLVMVMTSAVTWSAAYTVVAVPVVKTLRSVSAFRRQVALLLPVFADVISCLGSGLSDQSPAVIVVACLSLAVNCLWCLLYLCQKPADSSGYRKVEEESEDRAKLSRDMRALWLVLAISTSLLATTAYVIWRYDVTDTWAAHSMKVPEDVGWMWGMTSGCLGAVLHWLAFLARLSTQQSLPVGERLVLWGVGVMAMADSWLVTGAWLLLHPPVHLLPSLPWLIDRAGFIIISVSYLVCRHTGRRLIPACCFQRQYDTESGHNEDDIASWGIWKKQKENLQDRRGIFDFGTFAASGAGDRRGEGKGREGRERWEGKPLPSSLSSAPESLYGALQNCYEWDTEDQTDSGDDDLDRQDSGYNTSYRKVTSPRRPSFNRHLAKLSSEAREERVQEWVMSHDHVTAKNDVIIPRHSVDMSPEDETPRQFPCEVIPNEGGKTIPSRDNLNSYAHRSFSSETAHTNLFEAHPVSPYDVGRILAADDEDDVTLFMRDDVRPRRNTTFDHGLTDNFMNINRSSSELGSSRPSYAMNHVSSANSLRTPDAVMNPVNQNKTFDTAREGWTRRNLSCLNGRNDRQQSSESIRTDTSATTTTTATTSTGDVFHDNNNNGGDDDVVLSSPCSGVSSPRCWLQWKRPDLSTSRSVTDMSVFQ